MAQVSRFRKYLIKCEEKILDCELFYSELKKRHNASHVYLLSITDNIHRVENDNTVLIRQGCKC